MAKGNTNTTVKYTIIRDRVEIFKDFTTNLLEYIFDFYLDKETLYLDVDIKNYFMFCYNKVCDEFIPEGINFKNNSVLIDYFYTYYYHHFFKTEKELDITYFMKFWLTIFDVDKPPTKNMLNVLIELYGIFDKSIDSKKNILEYVE